MKILVVEDQVFLRHCTVMQLASIGLEAEVAADGRSALELARKKQYSLILMDIQMPEMDGFEATRWIRQIERERGWEPSFIVALTAAAEESECLRSGMNEYVQKPLTMQKLKSLISRLSSAGTPKSASPSSVLSSPDLAPIVDK